MRYVKTNGFYVVAGDDNTPHETVNPGSVVAMEDEAAKEFIKRGLGVFCGGPESKAPYPKAKPKPLPPPTDEELEEMTRPDIEKADLGAKLAKAEQAVAPRQARAGAI